MIYKEDVTQIITHRIHEAEKEILQQADNPDVIEQMTGIIWELNNIKDEVNGIRDEPDYWDVPDPEVEEE